MPEGQVPKAIPRQARDDCGGIRTGGLTGKPVFYTVHDSFGMISHEISGVCQKTSGSAGQTAVDRKAISAYNYHMNNMIIFFRAMVHLLFIC